MIVSAFDMKVGGRFANAPGWALCERAQLRKRADAR
jgi:hypothetical protein